MTGKNFKGARGDGVRFISPGCYFDLLCDKGVTLIYQSSIGLFLLLIPCLQVPTAHAYTGLSARVLAASPLPTSLLWGGVAPLAGGVVLICWNLLLKRRVHSKTAHLEAEIERSRKNEAALRDSEQKIRAAAHDFNNLLTVMSGHLDLAKQKLPAENTASLNIDRALSAARHAAELSNMMLAYSGKATFVVKELNINDLVKDNVTMLEKVIVRNAAVELQLAPVLPTIKADAGQLQQVIMNLIINASEACVDGGAITISTGVSEFDQVTLNGSRLEEKMAAGRHVWLEVRDNGCGMDAETQSKLFDPFFTTKFTGRGLGMSAVLGIIRSHKGAFLVESSSGCGTVMMAVLPISASDRP